MQENVFLCKLFIILIISQLWLCLEIAKSIKRDFFLFHQGICMRIFMVSSEGVL